MMEPQLSTGLRLQLGTYGGSDNNAIFSTLSPRRRSRWTSSGRLVQSRIEGVGEVAVGAWLLLGLVHAPVPGFELPLLGGGLHGSGCASALEWPAIGKQRATKVTRPA